ADLRPEVADGPDVHLGAAATTAKVAHAAPAAPHAEVAEDRAEELREVAEVAALDRHPASGGGARGGAGELPPVRAQVVVALALVRVGEHLVGLGDLLEAVGRALVDVGVVLARELPVGGLDRLLVSPALDLEGLVVVLEFHSQSPSKRGGI